MPFQEKVSSHLPGFLSVKYQLNENILTTKLMFTSVILNAVITMYSLPVFFYHSVNISSDDAITNATMQRIIAYAPWEASKVFFLIKKKNGKFLFFCFCGKEIKQMFL